MGADGAVPVGFVPHGMRPWSELRQRPDARLCLAELRLVPELRGADAIRKQYSPTAWPYIGPFYPYPQVPLAWRKVSLEWDDGWWFLDFSAHNSSH